MFMVMAGVCICGVQRFLFITAMMLMIILVMVMANMLIGTMQADWFFAVLMIMASMFIGTM